MAEGDRATGIGDRAAQAARGEDCRYSAPRVCLFRHRYGLSTTLDREYFYPSLAQALDAINDAAVDSPMPPDEGMPPP